MHTQNKQPNMSQYQNPQHNLRATRKKYLTFVPKDAHLHDTVL